MKYKVTVEAISPLIKPEKYPSRQEIYNQIVDELDLLALVLTVNKKESK